MTSDFEVVESLRARLDEDEAGANNIHAEDCTLHNWLKFDVPSSCNCGWPERIRREAAAKREVIRLAVDADHVAFKDGYNAKPMDVLRPLLAIYDETPDLTREQRDVIAAEGT